MRTRLPAKFVIPLLALLLAPSLAGCVTNPATGKSQFNSLSREDEIAMGTEAQGEIIPQYGGAVDDPALQAYVTEVGMKMVPYVEGDYGSLPWEFTLLDTEVINAFALPGGKVFLTRGLAEKLDSEAEMAGVLGHEIGHVTAEHADKRITNQLIFTGVLIGASVGAGFSDDGWIQAGVPLIVGVGGQGFLLKFGRGEEYESDTLGIRYMTKAGYNPEGQVRVMQVLAEASQGAGRQPEFLSTHPYPESRVKRAEEIIRKDYPQTIDNPEYILGQQEYERRMLVPLSKLPPPKQTLSNQE
jgi:predicted Zn-dependent protease